MSAIATNGMYHSLDSPDQASKPASPASPNLTFQTQQSLPRTYPLRTQTSTFPATPTLASPIAHNNLEPPIGVSWSDFIQTWEDDHIARWLSEHKCAGHAELFKANDIRGDILLELDHPTLQEMGLSSVGDRFRILNGVKQLRKKVIANPISRGPDKAAGRRRESGRPAPLRLNNNHQNDGLPRLVRDQGPDSAKSQPSGSRSAGPSSNPTSGPPRGNLPPLPPPPRGQPPLPPGRPPVRNFQSSGRKTPTPVEVPPYANQALPPAPNQGLLTPSSANSNWTGGYHLPADPRPGNVGSNKTPQSSGRTSPLARGQRPALPPGHARSGSASMVSPVTPTPVPKQVRPGTAPHHPYSSTQASKLDLSPIAEGFNPGSPGYRVGVSGGFSGLGSDKTPPTPSSQAANLNPSLDVLRRKLVKIALPDEGLIYTIDVDNCAGGVEILEKVLKKFGKGGLRSHDIDGDNVHTEDGGLSVDGWGMYLEDGSGPLDEATLLSFCHASLSHPGRDKGLQLRKIARARLAGLGLQGGLRTQQPDRSSKAYKRASSISVLSGLGVPDPERALQPPSPTASNSGYGYQDDTTNKRPFKLRNFFGQRPPSEMITTHLPEYFPFTDKKVLERTARQSVLRKRDSTASYRPPPSSRFSTSTIGSGRRMSRMSMPPPLPEKNSADDDTQSMISEYIPRVSLSTDDGRSIQFDGDGADDESTTSIAPQLLPPIPFPTESLSEQMESLTSPTESSSMQSRMSRTLSVSSRASRMSYMSELRSRRDKSDTASLMTVDEITQEVESRRRKTLNVRDEFGSDTDEWTEVSVADSPKDVADDEDLEDEGESIMEDDEDEDEEGDEEEYEEDIVDETGASGYVERKANKWIKGALIGAGSFGKVYLGMDASSGLLMAVKQVELPTGSAPNEERKQSMLTALEHEIELLQDLQHDNIVQYLYSSLEDDCLNIFLEYVPGGSVTALLRNYGAFEETLVKTFVRQILQGLTYLHERGIVHRDIKGANILVDNKGGVKISDFGISKKVDVQALAGSRMHRASLQGSVFWMAPEVVKQSGHTQKADIWSVGCLVVEMLTGEHPWAQLTQMQAIFKIGSSSKPEIPSDISAEAQDFLTKTFELDQDARPSASEALAHPWITLPNKK
ncbi:Pkinase-domain-containing protein [Cylindrobasidium torrendii FP15055 ss-10]|uniref:Pkinase-domain-containing protein n=1 Tax=Cylindrobasidium torrendii FP15055 ss-10 TaxID=1314674 RepID=A0A0D7BK67_9AGAR|nr:Pkinase-domain-containing protein [Cylindrobasidium torrendii FP15055 ss-10]